MAMTRTYFNTVHRMTIPKALQIAQSLREANPTSIAHLTETEQALVRLAYVRGPSMMSKRRRRLLELEIRRLRAALNAQCQRFYGTDHDLDLALTLLTQVVQAVRKASNSVPCTRPACQLCRWIARADLRVGGVQYRRGMRWTKVHALEASLHDSDLA